MMRLLRFLITGSWHEHTWKILHQGDLWDDSTIIVGDQFNERRVPNPRQRPVGRWYDLQCETCGSIKHKRTI